MIQVMYTAPLFKMLSYGDKNIYFELDKLIPDYLDFISNDSNFIKMSDIILIETVVNTIRHFTYNRK